MKTLRIVLLLACVCLETFVVNASSPIRVSLKGKEQKLLKIIILQDASVDVRGYKGSDLTITGKVDTVVKLPDGYTDISALAVPVNKTESTEFSPRSRETNEFIELILQPTNDNHITIQVPEKTHFSLQFVSHLPQSVLSLTSLTGELMISANVPSVVISDITGPVSLNTMGINLKQTITVRHVQWRNAQEGKPLFFIGAFNADVVFYVPRKLKASLNLNAPHNRIYSNLPPDQFTRSNTGKGSVMLAADRGGAQVFITTEYGNILLKEEI
ncbi:hypothetical protein [Mucilaginibacter lacusdianchii]|uniref:hypothetical protein n=1 Tax=Mucilaginibacter lacusdianchii TaxID=2684211 RepID=UPI00131CEFE9|nr:hypothetical protein [Mucilaginibacter sp. JXJ CY 39]